MPGIHQPGWSTQSAEACLVKNLKASTHNEAYCKAHANYNLNVAAKLEISLIALRWIVLKMSMLYGTLSEFDNAFLISQRMISQVMLLTSTKGESNKFFQEFNYSQGSMEHASGTWKNWRSTKPSLICVCWRPTPVTWQKGYYKDTVHIFPYHDSRKTWEWIHARVVSIQHAIIMNMTMEQFTTEDIEFWAKRRKSYTVGKVMMNRKSMALCLRNAAESCHRTVPVNQSISVWKRVDLTYLTGMMLHQ